MSAKNCGVHVDCGRCEYASGDGNDSFEVTVPLSDIESGTAGTARLICSISRRRHKVQLKEWNDAGGHPIQPSAQIQQRLLTAIGNLADQQICGNHQICPSDVVRIVEQLNRR